MELPEAVERALEENETARRIFEELPPSHRAEYLRWVAEAKRPATRAARAERMVRMLLEKSG